MSLSHDDVQRIVRLLDASQFDELRLEADGIKLHLVRHGAAPSKPAVEGAAPSAPPLKEAPAAATKAAATDGLLDIRAPLLGTFYCAPKPGAAPFVAVGTRVEPDQPVGVIEVMKMMNALNAGVAGEVAEVLVRDGELVEFDQVLMRVRPGA